MGRIAFVGVRCWNETSKKLDVWMPTRGCVSANRFQHPIDFFEIERFGIKRLSDPFDKLLVFLMFRVCDGFEHVSVTPDAAEAADSMPSA